MDGLPVLKRNRASWWTDPAGWTANALRRMTPEQRKLVAGPRFLPRTIIIVAVLLGQPAWLAVQSIWWTVRGDMSAGAYGLIAGSALFCTASAAFVCHQDPHWRAWRRRRRLLKGTLTPEIRSSVGRVMAPGQIKTSAGWIPVPADAPALPSRSGIYRFYWLEEYPGIRGHLLSAQPIDPEESPDWHD